MSKKKYTNKELIEIGRMTVKEMELKENLRRLEEVNERSREIKKDIKIASNEGEFEVYLDVRKHMKHIEKSKISFVEKTEKIQKLLNSTGKLLKSISINTKVMYKDMVINELVKIRQSEKYKRMADSAEKQTPGYTEDKFFANTVKQVIIDGGGKFGDIDSFLTDMNGTLANNDLDVIDKSQFTSFIMKSSGGNGFL